MTLLHLAGAAASGAVRKVCLRRLLCGFLFAVVRRTARRLDREDRKERSMGRYRLGICLVCVTLASSVVRAEPPPKESPPDDVAALAARIDQLVEAGWTENHVLPAPLADDAEFIRRVYLDVAGRIPQVSEVHKFLDDKTPNKRRALVEELLKGPHYINHFTNVWRALLLPQNNNEQVQFFSGQIEGWVRQRLRDNKPYDEMVRELLTAPVAFNRGGFRPGDVNNGAVAFYQV